MDEHQGNPVDNLRTATEPDWNSYGAAPLTPEIIALADRIYENIHFVPSANGGFQIAFQTGLIEIEVEIDERGRFEGCYLSRQGD